MEAETRGHEQQDVDMSTPKNISPVQWQQAMGLARQSCARIYRDGGNASEAMRSFGLGGRAHKRVDWDAAVRTIALRLCMPGR